MPKTPTPFTKTDSESSIAFSLLPRLIDSFLIAGEGSNHSDRTLSSRRQRLEGLLWWAEREKIELLGVDELRLFFVYLNKGHLQPGGRWDGTWGNTKQAKPLSSGTVKSYHSTLRTFFTWIVRERAIAESPMIRIDPPVDRPDQIEPFTDEQVRRLERAAKRPAKNKMERRGDILRDEAIFLLLLDTGIRESELCGLTVGDLDFSGCAGQRGGSARITHGKGDKARTVPFSPDTKRALFNYLKDRDSDDTDPVFLSHRGISTDSALTKWGVIQLVRRWGKAAGISGVRCSPHTFRHTFAISFLRAGGNIYTLKEILGHVTLTMTMRYLALAQADLSNQHRQFSPVTRLRKKNR